MPRHLPAGVAFLLLSFTTAGTQIQSGPKSVAADLDSLLQEYHSLEQFNGSALVARDGQVILAKGYGMANLEWAIPNTPDARFRIGSLTKQFTAMLVIQLEEEGKLSVDDKLSDRLPYYRKDTGGKVTIRQLLYHTSGVPNYTDNSEILARSRLPMGLRDLITTYCSGNLAFEPGSKFVYNNSGYVILGAIIEEATGKAYEQVLKERILERFGMASSGYDHSEALIPRRAAGYDRRLDGMRNADFVDMSLPHAAGALYSTVEDLHRWDQALYETKLFSEEARRKLFTPGASGYACGWFVREAPVGPNRAVRKVLQNTGAIHGFTSLILRIPQDRVLIVLLSNVSRSDLVTIAQGIGDVLYGREPSMPKRSVARALWPVLQSGKIDNAVDRYREIKAKERDAYNLSESELGQLGRFLLELGRTAEAAAIFGLNAESFPNSSSAHASLGEAYAARGEKELAERSYARALELNPSNASAAKLLQKLNSEPK